MNYDQLAAEFQETAEQLETIAGQYLVEGKLEQYHILWHEGAVYRYCALRLKEEAAADERGEGKK